MQRFAKSHHQSDVNLLSKFDFLLAVALTCELLLLVLLLLPLSIIADNYSSCQYVKLAHSISLIGGTNSPPQLHHAAPP